MLVDVHIAKTVCEGGGGREGGGGLAQIEFLLNAGVALACFCFRIQKCFS